MSITSNRILQLSLSGDISFGPENFSALTNLTAIGKIDRVNLVVGNNTFTVPSISTLTVTGLTIILPAGNATVITMKGVNGDTGIPIHVTDFTSIGLDTSATQVVLNVGTQINNVTLVWT